MDGWFTSPVIQESICFCDICFYLNNARRIRRTNFFLVLRQCWTTLTWMIWIIWMASCRFDVPPLLLISLDGFRVEYLQRDLTPAISRVLNCGSRSYMWLEALTLLLFCSIFRYPSFPSKTFPNHLSIVTGLYPESHGIVGSYFIDFNISKDPFTPKTNNSEYFNGEPVDASFR